MSLIHGRKSIYRSIGLKLSPCFYGVGLQLLNKTPKHVLNNLKSYINCIESVKTWLSHTFYKFTKRNVYKMIYIYLANYVYQSNILL